MNTPAITHQMTNATVQNAPNRGYASSDGTACIVLHATLMVAIATRRRGTITAVPTQKMTVHSALKMPR